MSSKCKPVLSSQNSRSQNGPIIEFYAKDNFESRFLIGRTMTFFVNDHFGNAFLTLTMKRDDCVGAIWNSYQKSSRLSDLLFSVSSALILFFLSSCYLSSLHVSD